MELEKCYTHYNYNNKEDIYERRKNLNQKIWKIKKQEDQAFEKRLLNLKVSISNTEKFFRLNYLFGSIKIISLEI